MCKIDISMLNFDDLTSLQLASALSVEIRSNPLFIQHPEAMVNELTSIYQNLFCDDQLTYNISEENKRQLLEVFDTFLKADKWLDQLFESFALLYLNLISLKIFERGNNLTIRCFLLSLASTLSLDLDFRRLNSSDFKYFLCPENTVQITSVFQNLFDITKIIKPQPVLNKWPIWPDASYYLEGVRRLSVKLHNEQYLVKLNGQLIRITPNNKLEPTNAFLIQPKEKEKLQVDGLKFKDELEVPLIDLDEDLFTGLNIDKELPLLNKHLAKLGIPIRDVPEAVYRLEGLDLSLVKRAAERISVMREVVENLALEATSKAVSTDLPKFFLAMGGSGSGKSLLKEMVEYACNNSYVEASLDKVRYKSYVYQLLIAADHHADDYKMISQFANALRDRIVHLVLHKKANLLLDGSGIPYKEKYAEIIKLFKNSDYQTYVLVSESPICVPPQSAYESIPAYKRIISRFEDDTDHRTLPWEIAIQKHIGQARSMLDASLDDSVDYLFMLDSIIPKEKAYLLALTLGEDEDIIAVLSSIKLPFTNFNKNHISCIHTKKLPNQKQLVITNLERFVESIEKSNMNPKAKGPEDIFFNTKKHYIPDLDKNFWCKIG